jgi:shikimate kinase
MMGAGKSTVGRLVADRLGWDYLDSDAEVERATGRSVAEIFSTDGEATFRGAESAALAEALARDDPVVVSVAGGAVLDPLNRSRLAAGGRVVWLRAEPSTLAVRVGDGQGRPLLHDDPASTLARLAEVRDPLYAEIADAVVDVDHLAAEQVAEQVLAAAEEPT